jgi:hypothetical protein
MRGRSLLSTGSLKPYLVCPDCNAKYQSDAKTRRRQIPIALLALAALVLTTVAGRQGGFWILPAVASHILLWVYIGHTVTRVIYVPYPD